jgi:ABC-type enterochelin transport system permease subunit
MRMIGRSKMIEMLQIMTSNRMLTPKILFLEKKIHLIFISEWIIVVFQPYHGEN